MRRGEWELDWDDGCWEGSLRRTLEEALEGLWEGPGPGRRVSGSGVSRELDLLGVDWYRSGNDGLEPDVR